MVEHILKISILYLSLYNSLVKVYGVNRSITKKDFYIKISKHYLVPKSLRPLVILEMEKMKLIQYDKKEINPIKILDYDLDLEKDINKFYQKMGLF